MSCFRVALPLRPLCCLSASVAISFGAMATEPSDFQSPATVQAPPAAPAATPSHAPEPNAALLAGLGGLILLLFVVRRK